MGAGLQNNVGSEVTGLYRASSNAAVDNCLPRTLHSRWQAFWSAVPHMVAWPTFHTVGWHKVLDSCHRTKRDDGFMRVLVGHKSPLT